MNHQVAAPSPWIVRWSHLVTPGTTVLDVACGSGRHVVWFLERGHPVTGIDQNLEGAKHLTQSVSLVQADMEAGAWPLLNGTQVLQFGAVVVTNYLWRPLLPTILASVAPGGVLLYETFADGNAEYGRPSRPDFLLHPGELLTTCRELHVIAYENGVLEGPRRCVQRIVAVRPPLSELAALPSVNTL